MNYWGRIVMKLPTEEPTSYSNEYEVQRLFKRNTLLASTACYGDSFTFLIFLLIPETKRVLVLRLSM
jgi:hypothetical protein